MSIVTGYKISTGVDLGSIFTVSAGGAQVTGYKNPAGTDLGALFLNQTGGTTITGYKNSAGADLGSLFAIVPHNYNSMTRYFTAGLSYPCQIALATDASLNIFFADSGLAKINTLGTAALTRVSSASIPNTIGMNLDASNSAYVTSYSDSIVYKFTSPSYAQTSLITGFSGADAVAVDSAGNVFVANYTGSLSVFLVGSIGTARAIITTAGATTYASATSGTTKASALKCGALESLYIYNNKLYICDGTYGCIFYFSLTNITTLLGNAIMVKFAGTGTNAAITTPIPANTLATNSTLSDSYGICFDAAGNAYFTEWTGAMIKKVNTSGYITTLVGPAAVSPTITYSFRPLGICIDNANNKMYVTDTSTPAIFLIT